MKTTFLRRLKARKAKYGYRCDSFGLEDIEPAANLIQNLEAFPKEMYKIEFGGQGYYINFAVYTDNDDIMRHLEAFTKYETLSAQ